MSNTDLAHFEFLLLIYVYFMRVIPVPMIFYFKMYQHNKYLLWLQCSGTLRHGSGWCDGVNCVHMCEP